MTVFKNFNYKNTIRTLKIISRKNNRPLSHHPNRPASIFFCKFLSVSTRVYLHIVIIVQVSFLFIDLPSICLQSHNKHHISAYSHVPWGNI